MDKWRFYQGQCTSWVAHRLNQLNKVGFANFFRSVRWSNASNWGNAARGLGIPVNGRPRRGSVAWYAFGHVGYVEEVRPGGSVLMSEMNRNNHNSFHRTVIRPGHRWPTGFIHIKDLRTTAKDPRGELDSASSPAAGTVAVKGWAFDPSAKTSPVAIHVYVGGKAGQKGVEGRSIGKARASRPDVGRAFKGVGSKHGFATTVETSKRGKQQVCAYAIDIGAGSNKLLRCRTVTIASPRRTRRGTDFNGDGRDDVFWYGPGGAYDSVHYGAGRGKFAMASVAVKGVYTPVPGDFDGDGRTDILWYGPGSAPDASWYGGTLKGSFASVPANVNGTYRPFTGDFNGDGRDDVFWYGPGGAYDSVHYGAGRGKFIVSAIKVDGDYLPLAGDFDGDGRTDVLWYGPGSAPDASWYGGALKGNFASVPANVNGTYRPFTGDFNGDGRDDVFWYGPGGAYDSVHYGAGRGKFAMASVAVKGVYTPVPGDFDGDGRTDVLWYGPGSAPDASWYGGARKGNFASVPANVNGTYTVVR